MSEQPILLKSVLIFTNPKGQHNSSSSYLKMDEVEYQTSIYVASEDIPAGVAISDSRWVMKLDNSTAYAAEQARQEAEGLREGAEVDRETAEGFREEGEAARNTAYTEAEGIRDGQYETAEGVRDGLFAGSQQDRTSAYDLREGQRDDAYDAQELVRDGLYSTAEAARDLLNANAEAARGVAEIDREEAEGVREGNEIVRQTLHAKWSNPVVNVETLSSDSDATFEVIEGEESIGLNLGIPQGDTGNGITSILRTSGDGSPGTTDIYTITYTDATTATFTVYNGQDYAQDMPLTWAEFKNHVRQGTITNYFQPGDQFIVPHATYGDIAFNIADITDKDGTGFVAPAGYFDQFPNAKPVTLLMDRCIYGTQFDAPEANYKVLVAIAAGPVNISLTSTTVNSGNAATYDLTVPAGGFAKDSLLRIKDASPTTEPGTILLYYATPTATAVEVTLTPGAGNTSLTVSPTEGAQLSVENHKDRVAYGSNNYAQSALRQWLNAAGLKKTFWVPKSIYDLPPTWYNTWDGFLNGMDAEFVAAVGATTRIVANNTVTDGGGSYNIADKFFLPSAMEIYATKENNVAEGVQFDSYVGLADINKIKYQYAAPSTAGNWWLRSPRAATAHSARYVYYTTGALDSGYANYGIGAAAACVIL